MVVSMEAKLIVFIVTTSFLATIRYKQALLLVNTIRLLGGRQQVPSPLLPSSDLMKNCRNGDIIRIADQSKVTRGIPNLQDGGR